MTAVAAAACAVMIFIFFDLWGLIPVGVGIAAAVGMFVCKNLQEKDEAKKNPPAPRGDFITGRVPENKDGEEK